MGGLLPIFEFKQGRRMAKKIYAHKRHQGGLEAPRNSLDLQVEASQNHCTEGELPDYYQAEEDHSENNNHNSNVGSMKKLINEELSKKSSTRQNAPSLVARLMGLEMMPIDTKSAVPSERTSEEDKGKKFSKKEMDGRGSISSSSSNFNNSSRHMELDSFYEKIDDDDDGWSRSFGKPIRRREHPQEEELQKFKKEFEAHQAARFLECSKVAEFGSVSRTRRLLPQENNKNMEKVTHNASSKKHAELENHSLKPHIPESDSVGSMQKQSFPSSRSRTLSRDFEESLMMKSRNRLDRSSSPPTRIVILKPGPDSICNHEESCWSSSSSTLQGRNSIEDFLEEVRDRLRCELLQGKIDRKGSSAVRGSGIETPYNEKPSNPKQIAHHIVKQVRENVARDAERTLLRSESTRSHKSEMQLNAELSSSERLRYVDIPEVTSSRNSSRSHALVDNHRTRPKQTIDVMRYANDMSNNWGISRAEKEVQTRSFRHDDSFDNVLLQRELSSPPRNLVRSLSAPVVSRSGTSFGKLLLEDRHILTGAHIRRKLEAVETMPVDDVKKQKKDRFNIKEKVSNFRHNLGLRGGRLFGRRNQSMVESSYGHEYYGPMVRDVTSGPTVLMNFGERHENSTEVPPSPASVCSSVHEEFWRRTEYLSPISTPDVSSRGDDSVVPHVFRDISSGLSEIRRQLNQLDSDATEDLTKIKQEPVEESEVLVQLDDPAECYIRDLLVASGLYFGSWDKSLLRGDTFAKPIGKSVFEEVEESHRKLLVKENDDGRNSSTKDHNNENKMIDHRLLLDLLNEALSVVLGPPLTTLSGFRRKLNNSTMILRTPPCGKELLKLVWDIICVSLYPPSDMSCYSLDTLVAQYLGSIPWSGFINEEINVLGREIECLITDDLIEELTKECYNL